MKTAEYINHLRQQNILLQLFNDELKIKAEKAALTDQLIAELRQRKAELTNYLKAQQFRSITKAPVKEYYPLSAAQRRLYFMHAFNKTALSYNLPYVLKLQGNPDKERISIIFSTLVARHESFRTCFVEREEEVVQQVAEAVEFEMEFFDTATGSKESILKEFVRPFDLSKAPLLRAALITVSEQEHILAIDMHHIIADGVSRDILIKEFMSLYADQPLPVLPLSYKDYAEWQQSVHEQERVAVQQSFWVKELTGATALDLPLDFNRPMVRTGNGASVNFSLTAQQTQQVKHIAATEGVSMFMLLLAGYNILLSKLCNQEDIVIGIPAAGRHHADLEGIIGMFVNTLPFRNYPAATLTVKEFLAAVKSRTLAALEQQECQYEDMIEALQVPRDTGRNPLFDTVLSYQNFEDAVLELPGMEVSASANESNASKFDLSLLAWEAGHILHFGFEYSTDLFRHETIARFAGYYTAVLSKIIENINCAIGTIDILPVQEKRKLLVDFNDTRINYPEDKSVIELFEEQANRYGNNIAVCYDNREVNYTELNNMADALAGRLMDKASLEPNDKIAFILGPSVEMIVTMLAILKTGCTYIALSPTVPASRNQLIYKDCGAKLLVSDMHTLEENYAITGITTTSELLVIKQEIFVASKKPIYRRPNIAESIIYTIYTSGSTGMPKGVEVRTSGILNMIHFYQQAFGIKAGMRSSQCATIVFDASAFEIWPCLTAGAALHIAPSSTRLDAQLMSNWLADHRIHITFQPPAMAELLLKQPNFIVNNSLTVMNVAGDVLNYYPEHKLPFRLFNLYGPTEDSIWTTWLELDHTKQHTRYSIGRPIANKKLYILDKHNQLTPIGVAGELCISGKGLAKGYLNNERLTNEKFIPNPFNENEKLYKTGDLARWSANGEIEFLGRLDNQVKIRGFRIETGEIEQQLNTLPAIKESVVVARESEGYKYLAAYYVPAAATSVEDIKNYLQQRLPDYMVPSFFVELAQLPLSASGKVNRAALPEPDRAALQSYVAPAGEIEEKLVELWSAVLKIEKEKISVNVNFFELGGDSITIQKLNSKINHHFGTAIAIADMFRLPTIRGMKDFIIGGDADTKKLHDKGAAIDETVTEASDLLKIMETI